MNRKNKSGSFRLGFEGTSRRGLFTSFLIVGVLILAILVNALVGMVPDHLLKWNVTGNSAFKVSEKTADWLKEELHEDITLYLLSSSGKENEVYLFLSDYAQESDHITLEVIDPSRKPDFINAYGGVWPEEDLSIIVESEKRYKIINTEELYYYYSTSAAMRYTPLEYEYYVYMFEQYHAAYPTEGYDQALSEFIADTQPHFDGETQITSAIIYATMDEVSTLYAVTSSANGLDSALTQELWKYGYEIKHLATVQSIPANCDLLVLSATKDLNDAEKIVLDSYLAGGGKLFLTTSYAMESHANLGSILEKYGMSFLDKAHLLVESDSNYLQLGQTSSSYYYAKARITQHDATGSFGGTFMLDLMTDGVHVIRAKEVEGVTTTPWLQTSEKAYPSYKVAGTNESEDGDKGVYAFGMISEKGDTRIVWVATPSALSAAMNSQSGGGNFDLAISAFHWLTGTEDSILFSANAPVIATSYLTVSDNAYVVWGTILVVILPIATLVPGLLIWFARKRR